MASTPKTTPALAKLLEPTFHWSSGMIPAPDGPAGNCPPPMKPLDCARGSRWLPTGSGLEPASSVIASLQSVFHTKHTLVSDEVTPERRAGRPLVSLAL